MIKAEKLVPVLFEKSILKMMHRALYDFLNIKIPSIPTDLAETGFQRRLNDLKIDVLKKMLYLS